MQNLKKHCYEREYCYNVSEWMNEHNYYYITIYFIAPIKSLKLSVNILVINGPGSI